MSEPNEGTEVPFREPSGPLTRLCRAETPSDSKATELLLHGGVNVQLPHIWDSGCSFCSAAGPVGLQISLVWFLIFFKVDRYAPVRSQTASCFCFRCLHPVTQQDACVGVHLLYTRSLMDKVDESRSENSSSIPSPLCFSVVLHFAYFSNNKKRIFMLLFWRGCGFWALPLAFLKEVTRSLNVVSELVSSALCTWLILHLTNLFNAAK